MRSHLRPILTLLVITPFLTELLSNNLAPSVFFNPLVFVFLATIGYGFPVLLLREFAVRKRMGIPGLICLGLVYGIINEGILAKTFYLAKDIPINTFDGYGRFWGISVPWAITISVWHAFHSLLYPILVTYYFFPDHHEEPWLTRKSVTWLAVPTILVGALLFFTRSQEREAGHLPHFLLMIVCMGSILWIATRVTSSSVITGSRSFHVKPILLGFLGLLVLFLSPLILSSAKVPVAIFYGYFVLVFALILRWLSRQSTLSVTTALLFALGDDIVFALLALIGAVGQGSVQELVASILFLVVFALLITRLRKDSRECQSATP